MGYTVDLLGDGTSADPYRPDAQAYDSWQDNGDGTATVTLPDDLRREVRQIARAAAIALRIGVPWDVHRSTELEDEPVALVKQDLVRNGVKETWTSGNAPFEQGRVVSHDTGSTAGLWKATTGTSAEPSTSSDDWSLVFEV
jgi:hypothetical protein